MIKNALKALADYRHSFSLMSKLKLWQYFLVPMLISLLFGISIIAAAYGLSDNLGRLIARMWIWENGREVVETTAAIVSALLIILLGFITYKHVIMALSAPFMSPVSEKMERHLFTELHEDIVHRKTSNTSQLIRGLRINLRNLLYELAITLPLLLLSLIPVIGIVFALCSFFIQSYYAGFGNMDYTLERHFNYRDGVRFVKNNRWYAVGNGIVFMAVLLIPVVGIILVLPLSVTAASKTTLELLRKQKQLTATAHTSNN
ncbi:EI24 domain-containing protein [Nonlabens ponticola]|uniref:EI24 domain-containing protein n=1 Tax=Nonlabens ponticola TaxID=2496866 RepID=A0A3S9MVV6_9FLAO|nr:EI24 domain-containing protein [Nonlabens ponticola]AZQ43356.1 EI24 domain-containing protein [Nonlabens ponticola]